MTGLVDFDPSLDGYVAGRGTTTLRVSGYPVTVDATAVNAATFNVDFGDVGQGPNVATTYTLVPGVYVFCVPASNNCFEFSVTMAGLVDFSTTLDSLVSGRGTRALVVGRPAPTVACVGTAAAPVAVPTTSTTCNIVTSSTTTGMCRSSESTPATCTYDGQVSEVLGLGVHTVKVLGVSSSGLTASCSSFVSIVDATPPRLTAAPSPSLLWPPNHKLVPIDLHLTAMDNCSLAAAPICTATSSEAPLAPGSGGTNPDIVWQGATLLLRAERSGASVSRTYTISCTVADASGNTSVTSATVVVPHDSP
jgi:hypothetical protein